MESIEWVRKGFFSFVIGFIITIIIGVVMAILFYQINFQIFILTGGLPLSWLYYTQIPILGNYITYDYIALVLDLLFWTFVIFLISTRKKVEKPVEFRTPVKETSVEDIKKKKKIRFFEDLSPKKFKKTLLIIANLIAFTILIIMIILILTRN